MTALTTYILSTALMWLWIRLAYSKGGILEGMRVGTPEVVIVFVPVVNTVAVITRWMIRWPIKPAPSDAYNKFFRIKK